MTRDVLIDCLPWLGLLAGSVIALGLLVRSSGASLQLGRLTAIHRDQEGSVQSLSFVLTLPLFVWVMVLIVQISQLMMATVVVRYAAFAAARSAMVWIPARVPVVLDAGQYPALGELENCIGYGRKPGPYEVPRRMGPSSGGDNYVVLPQSSQTSADGTYFYRYDLTDSPKCRRIALAAAMACAPISPSGKFGAEGTTAADSASAPADLAPFYDALTGDSSARNSAIPRRLQYKLKWAVAATEVEIRFYHSFSEAPLEPPLERISGYGVGGELLEDAEEFRNNEIGRNNPITITVKHHFALLPWAGRLLTNEDARGRGLPSHVVTEGGAYTRLITASVTLDNEGVKSGIPYEHQKY